MKRFWYFFPIINRSSRMLEAVTLTKIETETYWNAHIRYWVACFMCPPT